MAPSSSSPPPPSKCPPPSPPLPPTAVLPLRSPHITPIQECEREEQYDDSSEEGSQTTSTKATPANFIDKRAAPKHHPTPLHEKNGKPGIKKRHGDGNIGDDGVGSGSGSISCNKCRPHAREKISVVPLDNNGLNKHSSIASPNGIFRSIFSSLTRKSPKSTGDMSIAREEQWKIAIAELSHKLIQATRKRDEALLETSRLKYSMAELEKKLNKLEIYCHNLKSGLDECSSTNPLYQIGKGYNIHQSKQNGLMGVNDKVIEQFLVSVSEARSSVRLLSRSLTMQLRHMGVKVFERISVLLQPCDVKISFSKNPKGVLFYLEALLNKAFFEDFESVGFQKTSVNQILNPIDRCEANYASFNVLRELTWEEVLNKGTRHFSEEFSRFCDRKMSEIVAMLGWNRAWPEPLLQAFFSASKNIWLVHLLANSVHPGLPVFRVDNGVNFDSIYMEDMGGARARKLVPAMVRIMVAPGFYVYGNVVKCKVLCRYCNHSVNNDKGLTPSP
ncbi:CYCLIN-DEPENDENT KINASE-LIKE PROTEIN [Salix koriyanagi]|uniref:CYCLIN-DEPENDENT KINASE-LIKE PROTEIN n=1 Tax=Salix koriyanagi TaxID=2511006 RepID=A0A9Q0PWA3_9ROSI|nr:CYCLIN-DEPENDENT KINASE-LIKE PROTEIN [Salix koriyanagi]